MVHRALHLGWVLLLIALVLGILPAAAQEPDATVRPDVLNMRYGPGSQYAVVTVLSRGAGITLLAQDDQPGGEIWLYGHAPDGSEGWLLADYLTIRAGFNIATLPTRAAPGDLGTPVENPPAAEAPAEAPSEPVAPPPATFPEGTGIPATVSPGVNVRTGPGTGYRALLTVSGSTPALAMGRDPAIEWIFVRVGEQDGWVYFSYVQLASGDVSQLPITDTITTPGAAPAETTTDAQAAVGPSAGLRWAGSGRLWLGRPRGELRLPG